MFQAEINVDYKVDNQERNLKRSSWLDDNQYVESCDPAPIVAAIPRIVELLDHLYLEIRNDLLSHLDEEDRYRVPEVNYVLGVKPEEPCR